MFEQGTASSAGFSDDFPSGSTPSSAKIFCSSYEQPNEYTFFAHTRVRRYGTTQTPSASKKINYASHTVTPSDTLQGIALRYNCSVTTLARINKLWSAEALHLKETIKVPCEGDSPPSDGVRIQNPNSSSPIAVANSKSTSKLSESHRRTSMSASPSNLGRNAAQNSATVTPPKESISDILSRVDSVIKNTSSSVRQIQKDST
ncbi:hypothetical protein WR25_03450 [Diploscapter pachys]|uniref:LysM domain-containing protein n=1 Tax=Diploscapter pachys TaxID=2018661 RepID=A0A2A2J7L9_9BILA|nr:hypothetical protein WR25_03450 [Diploscapter pachys]